jgi:hypothetical protein
MQWNYTSGQENRSLIPFQDAHVFYGNEINGDPIIAYSKANINLTVEDDTADILPRLNNFFDYEINQEGFIFEIDLTNQRLVNFLSHLEEACVNFNIELFVIPFAKKGCIFRLVNNQNNFTNLYRVTMYSLWKCFSNANEIDDFLNEYNYSIVENGPYRSINNFQYPDRAFSIQINHPVYEFVHVDTYNDIPYKFNLVSKILDYFDATCIVYDFNLDQKYPVIELDNL